MTDTTKMREALAFKFQNIMADKLSVVDDEIEGMGQASFAMADAAFSTASTGERELSEEEIETIIRKHVRNYEACGGVSLVGFDEAARAIIDRFTGKSPQHVSEQST